jgi:hypothetical protein
MRVMNESFNLRYLVFQQSMQQENRQFTMISNIMKAKHDEAKAAGLHLHFRWHGVRLSNEHRERAARTRDHTL